LCSAVGILSETLAVAHSVLLVIIARLFLPVLSTVLPGTKIFIFLFAFPLAVSSQQRFPEPIVPMLVLLATQRVMPVMRALAVQQLLRAALGTFYILSLCMNVVCYSISPFLQILHHWRAGQLHSVSSQFHMRQ
jgi:hypothetical protein